ncbi:MAG: hypothetical protein FD138_605 [Planctomycetota bacterium]|nr:MAG: hypothetical protein FD138_605 [Planctomycetota bacterium]
MTQPENQSPEVESRFHHYISNKIPWYVHLMWVLFWIFVVSYVLTNFLPALKIELVTPP